MSDFVEHIREDGTIEMRNVRYDELIAVVHEPEPTPLTFTAEEIAEAYLNFGYIGSFIIPFIWSAIFSSFVGSHLCFSPFT